MDANKLKTILSGARAVMQAVDSGNYQKGNIDPTMLSAGSDSNNLTENISSEYEQPVMVSQQNKQMPYRNLHTTKMPKEIVQAMIENPIPIPDSPYHTFELNEDFLSEINPESVTKKPQQRTTNAAQRLAENKRNSTIGLTEDEVRNIVRQEMEQIIYEYFDKRVIKEDIQIKVGDTIFSGKLSPLPSKKVVRKK
jgi:hypothetical protein